MRLRELRHEDAPLMYEWMQDDFVVQNLATNFKDKTEDDCIAFINETISEYSNPIGCRDLHMAIADDNDEYMGTVSLKHIDRINKRAEFAITVRRQAMGKGYSQYAMSEIIRRGFSEKSLDLNDIYWCVDDKNDRAKRFYDKQNYKRVEPCDYMLDNYKNIMDDTKLIWYLVKKEELS